MVHKLCCLTSKEPPCWGLPIGGASACRTERLVGKVAMVMLLGSWLVTPLPAQGPGVHYLHQGVMPPGAIGSQQLQRGGPLSGFFQPVEIKAPPGVLISLAEEGVFAESQAAPVRVGMLIGQVYRIRVMNIPRNPGLEVFPTIEVIDRLYTPHGQQQEFPIVVDLALEDLLLALDGRFVTRVIYLEDPQNALPIQEDPQVQSWFEAAAGQDPLAVADQLGRPVAILRLGGRLPGGGFAPDMSFLFGCPPLVKYVPPGTTPRGPSKAPSNKAVPPAAVGPEDHQQ